MPKKGIVCLLLVLVTFTSATVGLILIVSVRIQKICQKIYVTEVKVIVRFRCRH